LTQSRLPRYIAWLVVAVPLVWVGSVCVFYLWQVAPGLQQQAIEASIAYAQSEWRMPILVGEVSADLRRGEVTAQNVFLGDPYSPRQPLVAAQEIRVRHLFSRQPEIQIVHPVAHVVRLPDGRWNFSPLIPKPRRPPAEAFWTLRIADGTLFFEDYKARPRVNATLRGVNGEIRSAAGVAAFRFSHERARPALRANVTGWYHNKQLRLRVDASDVPVARLLSYVNASSVDAGDAKATGTVWVYTDATRQLRYMGQIGVRASRARWQTQRGVFTVSNLSGSGEFATGVARWQAHASVGGGQVLAAGRVQWQPQTVLDVSIDAQKIPPRELQPWLRASMPQLVLHAPADANFRVQGSLAQPQVHGQVYTARAAVQRISVQHLRIKGILNARSAFLPELSLEAAGGTVRGQLALWQKGEEWQLFARWRAEGANLARLSPYVPSDVRGAVFAEGLAHGTLQKPNVVANLRGERLAGPRWRCERARARVRWTPGVLSIDGAMLEDWTGTAYLSGEIDLARHRLALRVRADEVMLAPWVERLAPERQPAGEAPSAWVYARGELSGTFGEPNFRGVIEATDLQWRRWHTDYLVARVEASPKAVRVEGGILRRPPMEVSWQGELRHPLEPEKAYVTVNGVANNVEAQGVLSALREQGESEPAPQVEAVGRVFFHVSGRLRSPIADITLSMPSAQIQDWSLTEVGGAIRYEDSMWKVSSLSARLGEGILQAEGEWDLEGRLAFRVQGDRLPLAQIRPLLPKDAPQDMSGTLSVRGIVAGSDQAPEFRGELQAKEVVWDTLTLSDGYAQVAWRNGDLIVQDARLAGPELDVILRSLRWARSSRVVEADGTVSVASLERLSQRAMDSTWLRERAPRMGEVLRELGRITGTATIPFQLWGESSSPVGKASVRVEDIEIDGRMLGTLQAKVRRGSDGSWQLWDAVLGNGEHRLLASGTYRPEEGELHLSAEVYNFDLSWFQRWLPTVTDLRGKLEMATLEASGKSKSPNLMLTLALKDPQFGALRADRVLTGTVQLTDGKIDISEVTIAQQQGQVRLWGIVPFRWEPVGVPDNEPIDLRVEAAPQPLEALLAYLPAAGRMQAEGVWSLRARLEGTRAAPQLSGEMQMSASEFRAAPLATGLRDLRAVLQLTNDTVRLAEFSAVGDTPRGGRIVGSGIIQFGGQQQERIDASLKMERFWLEERNLSGQYGEQIRAFLDGTLKVTGAAEGPQFSGTITASSGAFTLPASFPEQRREARPLPFNPRFDSVVLRVGEGMWLNSPRLTAQASGDIVLSGTLQEPVVRGQLGLERGYVYFPTARFRLEPGGTIAFDYPVPGDAPFRVNVNVQATTSLSLSSPVGGVRRYGITVLASGAITSPEGLRAEFRSDPPDLSTQQIARALGVGTLEELLTGRNVEQALEREVVNLFTSAYVPQLFSPLERGIEEALQLREFRIEYDRYQPVTVTLVKRLGGGFSLSYWRTVSTQQDRYVVKLLYELPEWTRLSRRLLLSVSVDERQQQLWGVEGSFRF